MPLFAPMAHPDADHDWERDPQDRGQITRLNGKTRPSPVRTRNSSICPFQGTRTSVGRTPPAVRRSSERSERTLEAGYKDPAVLSARPRSDNDVREEGHGEEGRAETGEGEQ